MEAVAESRRVGLTETVLERLRGRGETFRRFEGEPNSAKIFTVQEPAIDDVLWELFEERTQKGILRSACSVLRILALRRRDPEIKELLDSFSHRDMIWEDVMDILAALADARSIPFLQRFLADKSNETDHGRPSFKIACRTIVQVGEAAAVPFLVRLLDGSDDSNAQTPIKNAILSLHGEAVPAIIEAMQEDDYTLHKVGVELLTELRDPRGIDAIAAIFGQDEIPALYLLECLMKFGEPAYRALLIHEPGLEDLDEVDSRLSRLFRDKKPYLFSLVYEAGPAGERAAKLLALMKHVETENTLVQMLLDPDNELRVRESICLSLYRFPAKKAARALLALVEDATFPNTSLIASALNEHDVDVFDHLQRLAQGKDELIAARAMDVWNE